MFDSNKNIARLLPDGWTFVVELRDGQLYGGCDPRKLKRLLPLTSDAFVLSGSLGEWPFVTEKDRAVRIVNVRKLQPLVWTRVEEGALSRSINRATGPPPARVSTWLTRLGLLKG